MAIINLTEYLHHEMDILFVALNAPSKSNNNGHWFSGSLSFWNLFSRSGLITEQITNPLIGDIKVFKENRINYKNWIFGVTDLVRDVVQTSSAGVDTDRAQVQRIISILEKCKVRKLCLLHSKVAEEFEAQGYITRNYSAGTNTYGKVGDYKGTEIFEVPFHNASISNKELYYNQMIDTTIDKIVHNPKEPTKVKPFNSADFSKNLISGISITLPSSGNLMTESDIEKGAFRITVDFKSFFRSNSGQITVKVNNQLRSVSYSEREGRSDLLRIGKALMSELQLQEGNKVRITRSKEGWFNLQKL